MVDSEEFINTRIVYTELYHQRNRQAEIERSISKESEIGEVVSIGRK